ncbi:TPA: hypothetical protein ACJ5DT_002422 [Legionella pneumophila]|uniref:Uncharacterized protein n=1 Tax=Legionella pneumophila TaxID=446 RepID=A0A2S6EXM7_LEGPN|nr:hypothetical protein [Legionella pneumophila]APF03589.1 hypothetical protein BIZ52_09550 [Legionella pneumophila subsp. fraseri]APF06611.1 hypothetical protein BIZ51_09630 [Legionella pneumophila subsp. fraseri]AUB69066.1 hypothetical protein BJK09_09540 [Legionella pneumophila]AUB72039.1 hypothetical protein BJK08_09535 [Legionella pneumophila]KXB23421.1 hypothetical protein PtVF89_14690 [Legionella pneumophila]
MFTLLIITDGKTHISSQSLELVARSMNLNYQLIDFHDDIDNIFLDENECFLIYHTTSSDKSTDIANKLGQQYFTLQFPFYGENIPQEVNNLNFQMILYVIGSNINSLTIQKFTKSDDFGKPYPNKQFLNMAIQIGEKCSVIEKFCDKFIEEKQKPILLINSNDLNTGYYQQIKWFTEKINMKLSVIGQTTIVDSQDYLILNNQINLPQEAQFKKNIYGHQVKASVSDISVSSLGIHMWQSQKFESVHLAKEFIQNAPYGFPLMISLGGDNATISRVETLESGLSMLTEYYDEQFPISFCPHTYVDKRRKLLLIENTIIAVLQSDPYTNCEETLYETVQYIPGNVSEITEREQQAIEFLVEKLGYNAGWMIEYFIDAENEIYIISLSHGYDLSAFMSIKAEPILIHIVSKLLEQYFNNKLQTALLNNINQLKNGHQRFNLIAAYYLDIGIEPIDGSLEIAKLTYLNRSHLVSRCAFGEKALSQTFRNKYSSKKKFQQRVLKKHPEVVIPTVYLSNKINYTVGTIERLISNWSFPMVLKPDEGISCDKLFIDLRSPQAILDAHQQILSSQYKGSLLQPKLNGKEYRVVLVNQSIVAIARKKAAQLVGDGKSTIRELIQQYNERFKSYINEDCNNVSNNFYIKLQADKPDFRTIPNIKIDVELTTFLAHKGLTLESILSKNVLLELLHVNIEGATWENAWGKIEDCFLEKIKQVHIDFGLKINGADVLITDDNELKIFEFNCYPAIMFHHFILRGKPEPVIQSVYNYLFKRH